MGNSNYKELDKLLTRLLTRALINEDLRKDKELMGIIRQIQDFLETKRSHTRNANAMSHGMRLDLLRKIRKENINLDTASDMFGIHRQTLSGWLAKYKDEI